MTSSFDTVLLRRAFPSFPPSAAFTSPLVPWFSRAAMSAASESPSTMPSLLITVMRKSGLREAISFTNLLMSSACWMTSGESAYANVRRFSSV